MKNRVFILSFLISMISVNFVFAQTSTKKLSYQAVVRNAANELVVNQNLAVEITILDAGNAPQYRETHPSVPTNQNGLLWLWIGEGNPTLGTMANVVWKDATIRSIFTLPDGNTVTQNTPVTAMPHAFFADEVDTVFLQNYLDTHDVVPDNYVTHPQLNDTLGHYYTNSEVDSKLNDYEKKSELCGDVTNCIKDTLGKYTTSSQIDTLLGAYYDTTQVKTAIHDTADAIRAAIPASQVNADWNATGGPAEILNKPDLSVYATTNALKDSLSRYVGKDKLNDTLNAYYDTTHIKRTLKQYLKTGELCDSVMNCNGIKTMQTDIATNTTNIGTNAAAISSIQTKWHNDSITLTDRIHDDSLTLAHRMDTVYKHLCDSVMNCTDIQTMQTSIETNTANIGTNAAAISSIQTKWHNDSITLTDRIHDDSLTLAHRMDTVYKHLCDSVMNCTDIQTMQTSIETNTANIGTNAAAISSIQTKWHNDSITLTDRIHDDSLTLAHRMDTVYKHLCDSVMNCTGIQSMQTDIATNTTNIATNAAAISSLQTKWHNDSITLTDRIHDDSLTLAHRMDTVYKHLCDSIVKCDVIKDMRDSLYNAFDTLKQYFDSTKVKDVIHDSLNNYKIKNCEDVVNCMETTLGNYVLKTAVRDSVNNAVKDALKNPASAINKAVDTIAENIAGRAIHDSLTYNVKLSSNSDSIFLKRGNAFDTVKLSIPSAQVQSDWNAESGPAAILNKPDIPAVANDATVNVNLNGSTVSSFTLDQSTTATVNLQNIAITNVANTFSGNNKFNGVDTFTNKNIVTERGFSLDAPDKTTESNCQVMVNACDLLALFDSLSKRIDDLEQELDDIRSVTPPTVRVSPVALSATTIKATAIANGHGAAVTSYEFCISTKNDMSEIIGCYPSENNIYTFTGLTPNTLYYVTAKATTMVGTGVSEVDSARTFALAPTATVEITDVNVPSGFQVQVSEISPKGKTDTITVQVCYQQKQDAECPDKNDASYIECTEPQIVTDTTINVLQTVTGLLPLEEYCAIVKVSNGDSTTIYGPFTVTTGVIITLNIAADPDGGTLNRCNGSIKVTYTATIIGANTSDYTFSWKVGDVEPSETSSILSYIYSTNVIDKKVTCTATREGYAVLKDSIYTNVFSKDYWPDFDICEDDQRTVTLVRRGANSIKNLNWGDGNTITGDNNITVGISNTYNSAGTYTITANGGDNIYPCIVTRVVKFDPPKTSCLLSGEGAINTANDVALSNEKSYDANRIDSVSDHEGNWYGVVQIGTQCWLKENMRCTTSPSTGTYIVYKPSSSSDNTVIPSYTSKIAHWYNNDSLTYAPKNYGLLYNWCAAMDTFRTGAGYGIEKASVSAISDYDRWVCSITGNRRGICPFGWHVPSNEEWTEMETVVNGDVPQFNSDIENGFRGTHAGKLATSCDWTNNTRFNANIQESDSPGDYSCSERNSSNFSALPTGHFSENNSNQYVFEQAGPVASNAAGNNLFTDAVFWSSQYDVPDEGSDCCAWTRSLRCNVQGVFYTNYLKAAGYSVRCVRDDGIAEPVTVTTTEATNIEPTSATLNGSINNPTSSNVTITEQGFKWKASEGGAYTKVVVSGQILTHNLTDLDPNTGYTFCAYAAIATDTIYGDEVSFSTSCNSISIDLGAISSDYEAQGCVTLTGTLTGNYKISIADGARVTLQDITINGTNSDSYSWAGISCEEGDATIILEGTNNVKGFYEDYPGVYIAPNITLTIQGAGTLNVSSYGKGAGIGGGRFIPCGNIIVNSGTIVATGGAGAAGIGGGLSELCGYIRITGGNINAEGGNAAAGIGGGYAGSCGDISITGGTIEATGGGTAAGIGTGQDAYGYTGNIIISGGNVTAQGGGDAAGIGTGASLGSSSTCGNIIISDGLVTATGGPSGAGIGSGDAHGNTNKCGKIVIEGGNITATGGQYAAGIGSGIAYEASNSCDSISISGGIVTAAGGQFAAGIGSGIAYTAQNTCGNISITGGKVTATGGHSGAGVGNGFANYTNICGNIYISGGIVIAEGGEDATGIGNGRSGNNYHCVCGKITIGSGVDSVKAIKGVYSDQNVDPEYVSSINYTKNSIGWNNNFQAGVCDTVTIGGIIYWDSSTQEYQHGGGDDPTDPNNTTTLRRSPYIYKPQH